jgi:Tfp pilus assembly protein PilZ
MTQKRSPRYVLKLQIVYDDGNSFMSGPVTDISDSGVFIETVMPLQAGTKVRLLPLVPEEDGMFELDGVVIRKVEYDLDNHRDRTPGMGIEFRIKDAEQRKDVERLLAKGTQKG